jgi:preprotein translocase subunit YajC
LSVIVDALVWTSFVIPVEMGGRGCAPTQRSSWLRDGTPTALDAEGCRLLTLHDLIADALFSLPLLAQEQAAPKPTPVQSILTNPFLPIAGLFFLYYFIVIAPERRRKREETMMKSSLKKNDRIITIGGIHGTVVSAPSDSNVITIRIDEQGTTRVKINRSAIAAIVSDKEGQDGKQKENVSDTKDT